jgi:C-terminal processing protease CtpA/Prc
MFNKKRTLSCILLGALILGGCVTVDKFNARVNVLRNTTDLKSDVDFVQHKLEKLHPDLYLYITKKDLDFKFDSLKSSLTTPMTSKDFYFRLSPVIASIKQGHTQTIPLTKRLKYKERKIVTKNGTSPLDQFDFELFDNKLYIVKNNSTDSTIKTGTEILTVNGIKPVEIITKYSHTFTSDGNNTTFFSRKLGKGFPRYFYYEKGVEDSVICRLNFKDTIRTITLKRPVTTKISGIKKTKEQIEKERVLQKKEKKKRELLGYDPLKRIYSKLLTFPVKDSSVAIMKISDFMKGNYRKFYKKSFQLLDSLHTKTLILDLRDNGGGLVHDINNLYSYLADSSFHLINKPVVTSKTSLWHIGYYNNNPFWVQAIQTLFLPVVAGIDVFTYLKITKNADHTYRYAIRDSRVTHLNPHHFMGKVYVLINGGCFSATCLLSSNLKGSKRAVFVGKETGGAFNGCVAGIMPVRTLPNSKLKVRFGLLEFKTPYNSTIDRRGIFPDKEIIPTLQDRISGNDPELQWVLNDLKGIKQ